MAVFIVFSLFQGNKLCIVDNCITLSHTWNLCICLSNRNLAFGWSALFR